MFGCRSYFILILVICHLQAYTQNTVGLLSYQPDQSFAGYDLLYPDNQSTVYLIDPCGEVVHSWSDSTVYRPGDAACLQANGNLVKSKRNRSAVVDPIWAGGGGEFIEIRDWDNQLIFSFRQNDSLNRLHHDFTVLPNGHIIAISWEVKSAEEAIQAGRDPNLIYQDQVWPDYLLEIDPEKDSIVWEWHVWDHLVQDFDSGKANFGVVSDHPEKIDLNYIYEPVRSDWLHGNAVDYNEEFDHILLSVPHFNEVWIIDHSTTTEEASGSSGGKSGYGGDLLYRWGNPAAYGQGLKSNQLLFFQHDARWQKKESGEYQISVFNNRVNEKYSTCNIFSIPFDTITWRYPLANGGRWEPADFTEVIYHPDTFSLNSESVSSFQILPNGNRLILSGSFGYAFELTPESDLVWEYRIPIKAGRVVAQGDSLGRSDNFTFRYERYPAGFPGFAGKDLSPKGYLELNPNEDFCSEVTPVFENSDDQVKVYPNPFGEQLHIDFSKSIPTEIWILDASGRVVKRVHCQQKSLSITLQNLTPGLYFITSSDGQLPLHKVIKD